MNKFKKSVADLRAYLNRDTRGIELLETVSRIGNETREVSVAMQDKLEQERVLADNLKNRVSKYESEVETLKRELQSKVDSVVQLERQLALEIAKQQTNDTELEVENEPADLRFGLNAMRKFVLELYRDGKSPIQHKSSEVIRRDPSCLLLQSTIKDLSGSELMKLGRIVAAYAIFGGAVVVYSSPRFSDMHDMENEEVDSVIRRFLKWMKPTMTTKFDRISVAKEARKAIG